MLSAGGSLRTRGYAQWILSALLLSPLPLAALGRLLHYQPQLTLCYVVPCLSFTLLNLTLWSAFHD